MDMVFFSLESLVRALLLPSDPSPQHQTFLTKLAMSAQT